MAQLYTGRWLECTDAYFSSLWQVWEASNFPHRRQVRAYYILSWNATTVSTISEVRVKEHDNNNNNNNRSIHVHLNEDSK